MNVLDAIESLLEGYGNVDFTDEAEKEECPEVIAVRAALKQWREEQAPRFRMKTSDGAEVTVETGPDSRGKIVVHVVADPTDPAGGGGETILLARGEAFALAALRWHATASRSSQRR